MVLKRKTNSILKRASKYAKKIVEIGLPIALNHVTGGGTTDNADSNDGIINPVAPLETQRSKTTLSKRQKKTYKKKKNFAKKVHNALAGKRPINIWLEQLTTGSRQHILYGSATLNDITWQDVYPYTGSYHGWSMMHPGYLTTGYSGGFSLYPAAALYAMGTDPDKVRTATGLHTGNLDAKKIKTTHCRMTVNIKNVNTTLPLFVDIYYFVAAEDILDIVYAGPGHAWNGCNSVAGTVASMAWDLAPYNAPVTSNRKGAQPLDAPEFGKHWKQEGKVRMEIQPLQIVEWKHPSLRRVSATQSEFAGKYAVKHKTQAVMFVVQNYNNPINVGETLIDIEVHKQYHWEMDTGELGAAGVLAPILTHVTY